MKDINEYKLRATKALYKRYPQLTNKDVSKIVDRYVNAVLFEINDRLRSFTYSGDAFFVSTQKINQKSRSTINGSQSYMHDWFMHNCPLFVVMSVGSNLTKKLSEIRMMYKAELALELIYNDIVNGKEIDNEEALAMAYNEEQFELLVSNEISDTGSDSNIVITPISMKSLEAYINNTYENLENSKYDNAKLKEMLHQAFRIYDAAYVFDGNLIQFIKRSEFGRIYYTGANLQSCSKEVRHAALGNCIEYDIENSVYAWRYTEAKRIAQELDTEIKLPCTLDYLSRKNVLRQQIAKETILNVSKYDNIKVKLIKRAFTAISFGAKGTAKSARWYANGKTQTQAINDIIMNKEDRKRFLTHPFVSEFISEQKIISNIIYEYHKQDLESVNNVKVDGKLNKAKALAYLYQQQERKLLESAVKYFNKDNVLLEVHDAFYIRNEQNEALLNAKQCLQEYNIELKLSKEKHNAWTYIEDIKKII